MTISGLIIAVAIVGVNCWAFLQLSSPGRSLGNHRTLPAGVGALPLINVALVGTLLLIARRLRARRDPETALAHRSKEAFTLISLNLVILGGLYCSFTPYTFTGHPDPIDDTISVVADAYELAFGPPESTIPWIMVDALLLAVMVSGPPLLLAVIGQAIATRSTRTLPRRRLQAMAFLVALGFAAADLAVCLTLHPFEDVQEIALEFEIIDKISGQPITTASLRVTDRFGDFRDRPDPQATTDAHGRARLTASFTITGERNAFQSFATFNPWGRWLEISAEGHGSHNLPLPRLIGDIADPAFPTRATVTLPRGQTPPAAFQDIAGAYTHGGFGFGGTAFVIDPDGRFTWDFWTDYGAGSREYGTLERHGPEFTLIPIPHPGRPTTFPVSATFRTIPWGDRLYLSTNSDRDLMELCRPALSLRRYNDDDDDYEGRIGFPYLREPIDPKPRSINDRIAYHNTRPSGLPRLPARVWLLFVHREFTRNLRAIVSRRQ
jgi:hypothetical protein